MNTQSISTQLSATTPLGATATFNLSEPELAVVCATLDADWLPGMALDEDMADDEVRLQPILQQGVRTLTERHILFEAKLDDDDVTRLDEVVQAMVLVCSQPEHAVSILCKGTGDGIHQSFFYRVPDLAVLHTPLAGAQHQFELGAAESANIGLAEIARALSEFPNDDITGHSYSVTQDALAEATELGHSDPAAVAARLTEGGLPPSEATALAHTLAGLTQRVMIQFQHAISDESPDDLLPQTVLTFLSDGTHAWSLASDDP